MAEWSIAAVLKTVEVSKPPGVRIPLSPLSRLKTEENHRKLDVFGGFFLFLVCFGSKLKHIKQTYSVQISPLKKTAPNKVLFR